VRQRCTQRDAAPQQLSARSADMADISPCSGIKGAAAIVDFANALLTADSGGPSDAPLPARV